MGLIEQVQEHLAQHHWRSREECELCKTAHFILENQNYLKFGLTVDQAIEFIGKDEIALYGRGYKLLLRVPTMEEQENGSLGDNRLWSITEEGLACRIEPLIFTYYKGEPCILDWKNGPVRYIVPLTNEIVLPTWSDTSLITPDAYLEFGYMTHTVERATYAKQLQSETNFDQMPSTFRYADSEWTLFFDDFYSEDTPYLHRVNNMLRDKLVFYYDRNEGKFKACYWNSPLVDFMLPDDSYSIVLPPLHQRIDFRKRHAAGRDRCIVCGDYTTSMHHSFYIHNKCFQAKNYGSGNANVVGNRTKLPTFSVEFEMETPYDVDETFYDDDERVSYETLLIRFMQHGYVRTRDGSVSDELNSPIYLSNKEFFPSLVPMQYAKNAGYISSDCGTHIHVGMGYPVRNILEENYRTLFGELTNHIWRERGETTPIIWGRDPNDFARTSLYELDTRYLWLNLQTGYDTIEFRLPVFNSIKQYRLLTDFCRVFGKYLSEQASRVIACETTAAGIAPNIALFYRRFEKFALAQLSK